MPDIRSRKKRKSVILLLEPYKHIDNGRYENVKTPGCKRHMSQLTRIKEECTQQWVY